MKDLSEKESNALDRDLDRLQHCITALGEMRRGVRPRQFEGALLQRLGFTAELAHPVMDSVVDWQDGEVAEPSQVKESRSEIAPSFTISDHSISNPTIESSIEVVDPSKSAVKNEPAIPERRSVDSVLDWFDWR